ncbi:MAG TPA: 4'-phosphopantetheinyl transferase superfamily protein [Verrucomicrobiae bacterium]|nr:4'-phosphopantetheinyl transferase superfamily protein [Verrucomicrobiae bacterium]
MAETPLIQWPKAPREFSLGKRDVHVWAAPLLVLAEQAATYEATLSSDEQARAARFLFERDRRRFIIGRGILRAILGKYLRIPPAQIRFTYAHHGKPALADLAGTDELHFNLAHSEELAVFAMSRIRGIGIDVEKQRPIDDAESIAERFFSAHESRQLKSLPAQKKQDGFFNLWTRKEAWLKATGEGLGEMLNQIEVSLRPDEPARLLSIFNDTKAATEWSLRELIPANGFVGALAIPATDFQMHCWSWQPQAVPAMQALPHAVISHVKPNEQRL